MPNIIHKVALEMDQIPGRRPPSGPATMSKPRASRPTSPSAPGEPTAPLRLRPGRCAPPWGRANGGPSNSIWSGHGSHPATPGDCPCPSSRPHRVGPRWPARSSAGLWSSSAISPCKEANCSTIKVPFCGQLYVRGTMHGLVLMRGFPMGLLFFLREQRLYTLGTIGCWTESCGATVFRN